MMYLLVTGHRILARRWRGRAGEIDLVARRWKVIIFCEVKFRQHADESGMPSPRQRNSCLATTFQTKLDGGLILSRFRHLSVAD